MKETKEFKFKIIEFQNVKDVPAIEYFHGDNYSTDVFNAKYTIKEETPAEVFWRVCTGLTEDKELQEKWFTLMWLGWFRPGGSILAGIGANKKCSLANCTSLIIEDDTLEAIAKAEYSLMKIAAWRQGVGFDASRLRPRGSKVGNAAEESTGAIPWIDKLVNIAKYVGQKGRMPALLASLKIDHPDIEEFICCKDDKTQINSANISVQITDDFMKAVKEDKDWELYFKTAGGEEIKKTVNAKKLFKKIAEHSFSSAEPGVQYIDLMRQGSMVQCIADATGDSKYQIESSNACCIPGWEEIWTPKKSIPVSELKDKKNFEVLTDEGIATIQETISQGVQPVYQLKTKEGIHLTATLNHKIKTKEKGLIELRNLQRGDKLVSLFNVLGYVTFDKYEYKGEEEVFDLINSTTKTFTVNGIVVSNSEKPLAPFSVCNLLSINHEMFSTDPEKYKEELDQVVPLAVRMSDAVIDYELNNNLSPLPEQKDMVQSLREIGMGITNIHGWLLKDDIPYDSDEAMNRIDNFFKYYTKTVFKTSIELGEELGNAPAWDLVQDKAIFMNSDYFKNIINEFYDGDHSKIKSMRNMAHMSIAPTGSLSSIFPYPCISSGIEPVIGLYYWRKTRAIDKGNYTYYFVIPNRLKDYILSQIPEGTDDWDVINNFGGAVKDEDGKIGKSIIKIIDKYISKDFFKPAHEIDFIQKVKMMGRVYQWIDAAVSCTYNLPETAKAEDIENIYMTAWEEKVRAVSVYVEGSREGILIFDDPITNKNKTERKIKICEERPPEINYVCAPKRPKELTCNIHHCSIKGTPWLVIIGLMNDKPYEIFAGEGDDLYIPKTCKEGKIIKQSGGVYSLEILIRNSDVLYKDVAKILMNNEQRALTRMISLSLRHGAPLEFIQKQLKKTDGEITDFSTVIARVLGGYIKSWMMISESNICPKCGEPTMVREGGCTKCINENCHYNRCE